MGESLQLAITLLNKNLKWTACKETEIQRFLCPDATHITSSTRIPPQHIPALLSIGRRRKNIYIIMMVIVTTMHCCYYYHHCKDGDNDEKYDTNEYDE